MNYEAEGKITIGGLAEITNSAYTYQSSGSVGISGCADFVVTIYAKAIFKEGDSAYEARLAKKGRVEKLVIKKILAVSNRGLNQINYIDTLNGVYLEEELVNHGEAIELAIAYYELQQAKAIESLENSCN